MALRSGVISPKLDRGLASKKHSSTKLLLLLILYLLYILSSKYYSRFSSINGSKARIGINDSSDIYLYL